MRMTVRSILNTFVFLLLAATAHAQTSSYAVPAGGGASFTTTGAGSTIAVGYSRLQPSTGTLPTGFAVYGFRSNGILVNESAVPASPRLSSGRLYAELGTTVNTGLAIANPNDQTAAINFYFTDFNGNSTAQSRVTIEPNRQIAKFLTEDPFNATSPFRGTLSFTSSVPVSVIALRGFSNQRGEFLVTVLPVADLSATGSEISVFPHYADGGGWNTQIVLVNPANVAISGTIQFFGQVGVANLPDSISLSRLLNVYEYSIPPRSSRRLVTGGAAALPQAGWLRIAPSGGSVAPLATAVFAFQRGGITVSEAGVPAVRPSSAFRVYVEAAGDFNGSAAGSVQTGVAVANMSSLTATVDFELLTIAGESTGMRGSLDLLPNGQRAAFINQIRGLESIPASFQGVLRISTSNPFGISVIGLRARYNERRDLLIATTPPAIESSSTNATELIFPHLPDGGGYTSQFVLLAGSSNQSSSGALRFIRQSGLEWGVGVGVAAARELAAAAVSDANGQVTLQLPEGSLTFRLVDEGTNTPLANLSVALAVNAEKGRGMLVIIDPAGRYPLRFVMLQARAASPARTLDDKQDANSVEDLLVLLNTLESTPIVGKHVEIPGVSAVSSAFDDFAGLASLVLRTADQYGLPVGKYAQNLNRAETQEMTTDQAKAELFGNLADGIKDKMYMFMTEGEVPDATSLILDAFSLGVDANAVWNCTIGNRNVIVTTIRAAEKEVFKIYNCKPRGINISEAIPFTFGLSDPYGLPLCSGSLELISKGSIGSAYVRPLSTGTGSAVAPAGNYRANVRCPNSPPRTSNPTLPPEGGAVTLTLDPPPEPVTPPPPATPQVATVDLRPNQLTGFLDPGAVVNFTAIPRDRSGNALSVSCTFSVSNPVGSVVATINASTGVLTVGNADGAARVVATCGGVPSNPVLVSGRGETTTPPPPSTSVTQFDGRYAGSYSGAAIVDGDSYPVSGPVAFTIANGGINMTAPGPGTGAVSASGTASFAVSGGLSVDGASCRYNATFAIANGVSTGSGNWSCTFEGGSATGNWTATRQ